MMRRLRYIVPIVEVSLLVAYVAVGVLAVVVGAGHALVFFRNLLRF